MPYLNHASKPVSVGWWLAIVVSVAGGGWVAAKKPPPEIPLHVRFVDTAGFPVNDIQADEVEVSAAGEILEVRRLLGPVEPFDAGLVLDVSPSVEEFVDAIRNDTSSFFRSLRERDKGLILTFDSEIYVDCDWTNDRRELDEAIFEIGLHKGGSTSVIFDALAVSLEQKFWDRGPRQVMIFFSDGVESGKNDLKLDESLEVARRSGVLTYVIQYDPRPHYLRLHRGASYDPTWDPPPGSTGGSVGGIFVGTGRPSTGDLADYKVGRIFDAASKYLHQVADAGRGTFNFMLKPAELAPIYRRILEDLTDITTVTIVPPPGKREQFRPVAIASTRPGVVAIPVTKGYWPR